MIILRKFSCFPWTSLRKMIIAHSFWSLAASGAASSLFQTKIWPSCLGRCAFHSHNEIARWFVISYNDGHAIPARWVQVRYLWLSHEWFCSHLMNFHFTHLVSKSPVNSPYPPFINVPWMFCFFPVKEPRWGCSSVACQMCNWVQKMLYHLERPHDLRLSTLSSGHDQGHSVE